MELVSIMLKSTWALLGLLGVDDPQPVGAIPFLRDGRLRWVYNSAALAPGVEFCADPEKVEVLRRNAHLLCANEPTYDFFAAHSYRVVRSIMEHSIRTREDVIGWAHSIFNWGPGRPVADLPRLAEDAVYLSQSGFHPLQEWESDHRLVVIPTSPLELGDKRVRVLYADPAWGFPTISQAVNEDRKPTIFGPRSEITKRAFTVQPNQQEEEVPTKSIAKIGARSATKKVATRSATRPVAKAPAKAPVKPVAKKAVAAPKPSAPAKASTGRRVGRPRADGLPVGSREAEAVKAALANHKAISDAILAKVRANNPAKAAEYEAHNEAISDATAGRRSAPVAKKAPATKAPSKPAPTKKIATKAVRSAPPTKSQTNGGSAKATKTLTRRLSK